MNEAKKTEAKRLAKEKMAEINKAAEEECGDVEMEHVNMDNDGPTSGEGGVNETTTSPNKGRGRNRGDACSEEGKEREEESKEG